MKRKMLCRCEFEFKRRTYRVRSEGGLVDFKDGFWINDEWEFTKGVDARYWIPPSKILYVAKDNNFSQL